MKYLIKPLVNMAAIALFLIPLSMNANTLKKGDLAPNFNITTITGESISLKQLTGNKPIYLKFWATWCSYCKAEFPHLQAMHQKYGDQVKIIAINVGINDSIANINKLYAENGYDLPTFFDQNGKLTNRFGVIGTPHHILIDRHGKIAYRTFLATDQLDQILAQWSHDNLDENNLDKKALK